MALAADWVIPCHVQPDTTIRQHLCMADVFACASKRLADALDGEMLTSLSCQLQLHGVVRLVCGLS